MEPSPGASAPRAWRRGGQPAANGEAQTFGALLKELRDARNLSQQDVAARAGLDNTHVSRLESGGRGPSREAVERLADALDVSGRDRMRLLRAANLVVPLDPLLEAMAEVLRSEELPDGARERLRATLEVAIAYGRAAIDEAGGR